MIDKRYVLGIDTSNYKTSVAITDINGSVICDFRKFLKVKQGERGLRQSDALFQHIQNLPIMFNEIRNEFDGTPDIIAFSSKPRPVEGSYMPVFTAGKSFAQSLAAMLKIPCVGFSHQEGHIEAVKKGSPFENRNTVIACHFSGGTCEVLKVTGTENRTSLQDPFYKTEIIGGSLDISFGQVLDRAGVAMGFEFPAGEALDHLALSEKERGATTLLTPVKVHDGYFNLSGTDTQIKRRIEEYSLSSDECCGIRGAFAKEILEKISDAMALMIGQAAEKHGINEIIAAGGVSSSRFIRRRVSEKLDSMNLSIYFDEGKLSEDNAIGTAFLGGRALWEQNL